jgi:sugar phosphate isomerase/epimerase
MTPSACPFGVNTYSYIMSHAGEDCLRHLARHGYTSFELMIYPGHIWPVDMDAEARRSLRRFVDASALRILTLNMPNIDVNIAAAAPEMRRYSVALLESTIGLAGDLGVPGVIMGPGKANPLFPAPKELLTGYFFEALDVLTPLARKAGTQLYIENMPFAFLPDAEGLMQALERYGDDQIRVVYDIANAVFIREDAGEGLQRVRTRLSLVHLSDTGHQVYRHDQVGKGMVPFATIPPLLRQLGYHEVPMLEIISPDPDADIRDSVEKLLAMGFDAAAPLP